MSKKKQPTVPETLEEKAIRLGFNIDKLCPESRRAMLAHLQGIEVLIDAPYVYGDVPIYLLEEYDPWASRSVPAEESLIRK